MLSLGVLSETATADVGRLQTAFFLGCLTTGYTDKRCILRLATASCGDDEEPSGSITGTHRLHQAVRNNEIPHDGVYLSVREYVLPKPKTKRLVGITLHLPGLVTG